MKTTTKLFFSLMLVTAMNANAIETPDYTVVHTDGSVEYRQYEPYIVAETVVRDTASYRSSSNEGFMRLFRYITGANESQSDIAMTAPVQQAPASEEIDMTAPVQRNETEDGWRVAFMLPSKFSMDTAPIPTNEEISLRLIPGHLMAVIRYSGRWTERNFNRRKEELLQSLKEANVSTIGVVESAAYDAPYVLPFLRRNEVMIEVDSIPTQANAVAATE
ncbi:MAG: heme-binding protein [Gammaproteobacteria bacterium]|nr:heme-binding protein [Gammaproteobacteria bacterium]MDD9897022.1 heme-binding protein [Gammaproteobacteria bacterium]MDD9959742.1 heme-binding protein [Gammaproteobacteria bacterium]